MSGILYGVGVGPGDPRLITYLADTIRSCPVIAVPAETKEQAVSYRIASGLITDLDKKQCLTFSIPMTKDKGLLETAYRNAADQVEEQLKAGRDVACLTGRSYGLQHLYLSPPSDPGSGIQDRDYKRRPLLLCGQRTAGRQPGRQIPAAAHHSVRLRCGGCFKASRNQGAYEGRFQDGRGKGST